MLKKLLFVIVAAVIGIAGYVYYTYDQLGPGEATADWTEFKAVSPEIWGHIEPGKSMKVIATSQGWTPEMRAQFHHIDQGSLLVPYDIFLNIETHDGAGPFAGVENMTRLRYISTVATDTNPDALPIGFTKAEKPWKGEVYAGMNCMACHSTVITYGDTAMLIDGAPTMADFQRMVRELSMSLDKARDDPATFDALAAKIGVTGEAAKRTLHDRVTASAQEMHDRRALNLTPSVYGYGRVDAVGQIYNAVTSANLGMPENRTPPSAPVSFPYIWGSGQSDVVQWTGFAPNYIPGGVLVRNAGEVLGVFGGIDVPKSGDGKWNKIAAPSSINIHNLGVIEKWVNEMEPSAWPTDVFGAIDADLAARGKPIFDKKCAGCHMPVTPYQIYVAELSEVKKIKTDPLAMQKTLEMATTPSGGQEAKLTMLAKQVGSALLDHPIESIEAIIEEAMPEKIGAQGKETYKGRPLNSIWATAPYLHNGSVPTLADLLLPGDQRPKTFPLGTWEFDPVKVGYAPATTGRVFVFDTAHPGNGNGGHEFGTDLNEADRTALLEYLKSL